MAVVNISDLRICIVFQYTMERTIRMNDALYHALKSTEFLLDIESYQEERNYQDKYQQARDHHMSSYREALIYEHIGQFLSSQRKYNVLDVGSGELFTAQALIKNTSFVGTYTAIDFKVDAHQHNRHVKPYVDEFEYVNIDILGQDFMPSNQNIMYDIVIIDVEPHGKEIEVYEKIKHVLNTSHLCVLKHVGCIDFYGCGLANRFLTKYEQEMSDYYGESTGPRYLSPLHHMRDVFVIFDKEKSTRIRDFLIEDPTYFHSNKENIKKFCGCSKRSCYLIDKVYKVKL